MALFPPLSPPLFSLSFQSLDFCKRKAKLLASFGSPGGKRGCNVYEGGGPRNRVKVVARKGENEHRNASPSTPDPCRRSLGIGSLRTSKDESVGAYLNHGPPAPSRVRLQRATRVETCWTRPAVWLAHRNDVASSRSAKWRFEAVAYKFSPSAGNEQRRKEADPA